MRDCTCGGIWTMDPRWLRELADLRTEAEYQHACELAARISELWDRPTIGHYRRLADARR